MCEFGGTLEQTTPSQINVFRVNFIWCNDYPEREYTQVSGSAHQPMQVDEIVCSTWGHVAVLRNGEDLTNPLEHKVVYGAGANTLAANSGCSVADAKKFIKVFYNRYKGVKLFHEQIVKQAAEKGKLTKGHTDKGLPRHAYLHRMPTGRMYVFTEYDNEWKGGASYSPTELKNWPVQGFSTGDVVPHMVGKLVKRLFSDKLVPASCIPIMTVHDSIVLDVCKNNLDLVVSTCYDVLKNTSKEIASHFNIDMPVTLSVGCSVGPTWGDVAPFSLEKYDD